jgi:hypothetical protein
MVQYFDHDRYINTDTRVIYITSSSRTAGEIYNATFNLPNYVFNVDSHSHIEIQLQSFVAKYSFYNIDVGRNADMSISANGGVSYTASQLPIGNYNTKEIAENIQTLLRAVTGDLITVVWTSTLMKLKITAVTVPLTDIYVKFPKNETGYELFGVNQADTTLNGDGTRQFQVSAVVDTPTGFTGNYFKRIMSIGNEESLFLHADFGTNRNLTVKEQGSALGSEQSTFAKVHIIAPFFGNIYYSASSYTAYTTRFPDGVPPESQMRFWITDEQGNLLKLQNDYQMVLRVLRHRRRLNPQAENLEKLISLQAVNLLQDKKKSKK